MSVLLSNICRLCGEMTEKLIELFEEDGSSEYTYKIEHYLNVEIRPLTSGILQPRMCYPCKEKLAKWDKFASHVLNVQEFLDSLTSGGDTVLEYMVDYGQQQEKSEVSDIGNEYFLKRNRKRKRRPRVAENGTSTSEANNLTQEYDNSGSSRSPKEHRKIRLKITKIKEDVSQVEYLHDMDDERTGSDKENDDDSVSLLDDLLTSQEKDEVAAEMEEEIDVAEEQQSEYESDSKEIEDVAVVDTRSLRYSWECTDCKSILSSWNALARHCTESHGTGPRFNCLCGKTLTSRGSVMKHHLKHTVGLQHKCDKCSKSYHRKRQLDIHTLSHLPKEEQPWLCCKCSRRFHSEALLKQHERMHLPLEHKSLFPCDICQKKLCSKSALAAHVRSVHLRERPFVCDQCGLSFTSKGILDEHLNVHSDVFNYHCKDCGKSFKTKYRLRIHMDTHLETRYSCPVCGLTLNTRRTLRMHLLVHEDHKGFHCSICGKAFKRSKDLKNHANLHTGRKPYACLFCPRTFANGSNCRSHKRRMHPEELRLYEQAGTTGAHCSAIHEDKIELEPCQDPVDAVVPQQEDLLAPLNLKHSAGGVKDEDDLEELTASLNFQYPLHVATLFPPRLSYTPAFPGNLFFVRQ